MTARGWLERLSRRRVVRRRLPADLGGQVWLVSPDAALHHWHRGLGATEVPLLRAARELVRPGAVVWDLGANVGLFSAAAAFLAGVTGGVLAIEADSWLADLVRRSARQAPAGRAPIEVLNVAASSHLGVEDFCIAERGRAANHLASASGSSQAGGARETQKVVVVTLDWLLEWFPPPQLVKIDVEGAELDCLLGAARLLRDVRPVLFCEVADGTGPEIGELLRAAGYVLYDGDLPVSERQPLATPAWSTLAVPA